MNPIYPISFSLSVFIIITIIGIKKSLKFPKINAVNVIFRERFLSGKNGGMMGSYKNILDVVVTDQELWIRPFLPFIGFAAIFSGIHKIPLTAVQGIETRGKETTIYFLNSNGKKVYFSIYFSKTEHFTQAIEQLNKSIKVITIQ